MANIDPIPPVAPPANRRKRRILILTLAVLAVVSTYARWLPVLVELLLPPMAPYFGYELHLEGVQRCDLGGVRLSGLRLESASPRTTLRSFRAQTIDLSFGAGLLLGNLERIESLSGDDWRLVVAPGADKQDSPAETPGGSPLDSFQRLPAINLTNLLVLVESPEQTQRIAVARCEVDQEGKIELQAQLNSRVIEAQAAWVDRSLEGLSLTVDGQALVQDTKIDLSAFGQGKVSIDAHLPLGVETQQVHVEVSGTRITWQAALPNLDLAELEARSPIPLETQLAGILHIESTGELDWEYPLQAKWETEFSGENLRWAGLPIESLSGKLTMGGGQLHIPSMAVRFSEKNHGRVDQAILPLVDLDPADWLQRAQAQISLVIEDAEPLLEAFGTGQTVGPTLVQHRIALEATLQDNNLQVQEFGLTSAAGNIELESGSVQLGGKNEFRMEATGKTRIEDLGAIGKLFGREGWSGALAGNLQVGGVWPYLGGEIALEGKDLRIEGTELGQLELRIASDRPGAPIEVSRFHVQTPAGSLTGRLRVTVDDVTTLRLQELTLRRGGRELNLAEPCEMRIGPDSGRCDSMTLRGDGGRVSFTGSWAASDFDAQFSVTGLHPDLLGGSPAAGSWNPDGAAFQLDARRRAGQLEFQSKGELNGWVSAQWPQPIHMRWDITHQKGHLAIRNLEALQASSTLLRVSGNCPIDFGEQLQFGEEPLDLKLELDLPLAIVQEGASGRLQVAGALAGTWRALVGSLDFAGHELRLDPRWHPAELASGRFQGQLRLDNDLTLENASLSFGEWIDSTINLQASLPLNVPLWLERREVALQDSQIEASVDLAKLDIEKLRPLLSSFSDSFEVLRSGHVRAKLFFKGALTQPDVEGTFDLENGRVRPGGGLPALEDLAAELVLEKERVLVRKLTGTVGAAPFQVSGEVRLGGPAAHVELELQGDDLLLLRNPDARVRANTQLKVSGPADQLLVQGKLELTTGRYSPQMDFLNLRPGPHTSNAKGFQLFTFRDAPLRDMTFDIELTALEPFMLHNTIMNGSMRPDLHLGGNGLLPILNGTVYIGPTRLKLPATDLDLTGGTLRFLKESPFIPVLDIQGQTRQLGYDVRADITGPYDDPELLLQSTPPLNQEDLFLLLLTGRLPLDPRRSDVLSTANTVALYLAKDTLARWFADDGPMDEDSMLERLEFTLGQNVSKDGVETFDVAVRLTNRMGKPTLTKDARHAYLVAERDRFEDYNYGLRWVFRFRR